MKLNLQNAASPLIEQLNFFHDWRIIFVAAIAFSVLWYLVVIRYTPFSNRLLIDAQNVEFLWTTFPCLILVGLALPSLKLLYMIDEAGAPAVTLKAVGHQWYWSYEYSDFNNLEFDAYIIDSPYRLLDADHRIIIPRQVPIRVLVTAADVLHSWTIPVIGIKADAVPGRLNQLSFLADRSGIYYGQCSEICGSNHSFIPIAVECITTKIFRKVFSNLV